jgi:hypothetical protein
VPAIRKPLTVAEMERAINHDKHTYPNEMPCAICGHRWMQHMGLLCPVRAGGFLNVDGELVPVMPVYGNQQNGTLFVPDLAYYNQNPDFDVV